MSEPTNSLQCKQQEMLSATSSMEKRKMKYINRTFLSDTLQHERACWQGYYSAQSSKLHQKLKTQVLTSISLLDA
ncbi:uncharacterized protein J3R85_010947 [Psidium guajava]|nr:uncharacterized protein J3R85_010947 [Psidium guajava]